MTEKENPSGVSGPGTRTIEPSWDEESGNAAANEDVRDDELGTEQEETEQDDAAVTDAAYPTGSAEDEDEDETLDETDESLEAAGVDEADEAGRAQRADETEGSDEFDAPAGYGESSEDAEATDLTGYLPAYREPSATEPDAESGVVPGALSEPPPPASATPLIPGGPGLPGSAAGAVDAAGDQSERMREIQLGFVDNPRRAALDAQELLIDALQSLTEESVRERDALRGSVDEANPDTERMRLAVRRARELIDAVSSRY